MTAKFEVIGRMVDVSDHCRILLEGNGHTVRMTIQVKDFWRVATKITVSAVAEKEPGRQVMLLDEQEMVHRSKGWLVREHSMPVDDFYYPVRIAVYFGTPANYPNRHQQYMVELVGKEKPAPVGKRWVQMVISRFPDKTDDEILAILSGLLDKE